MDELNRTAVMLLVAEKMLKCQLKGENPSPELKAEWDEITKGLEDYDEAIMAQYDTKN